MYFDSAYLAKIYLNEPDSPPVRKLAEQADIIACSSHGQIETACVFHRKWREGALDRSGLLVRMRQLERDTACGLLCWLPLTDVLLETTRRLVLDMDKKTFLRAADALHLACARENGFKAIYSNDTRLMDAAKHFGLRGKNVIS